MSNQIGLYKGNYIQEKYNLKLAVPVLYTLTYTVNSEMR